MENFGYNFNDYDEALAMPELCARRNECFRSS